MKKRVILLSAFTGLFAMTTLAQTLTPNKLPKYVTGSVYTDSRLFDDNSFVGLNITPSASTSGVGFQSNVGVFRISSSTTTSPFFSSRFLQISPNYAGAGDLAPGVLMLNGSTSSGDGLTFIPNGAGTSGVKLMAGAYTGSAWKSVWETKNEAGGTDPNLLLVKSGGYVGIGTGTSAPISPLHIKSNKQSTAVACGGLFIENTGSYDVQLRFKTNRNANAIWSIGSGSTGTESTDDFYFWKEAGTTGAKMVIKDNGYVGIGTINPQARLDVNGNLNTSSGITTYDATWGGSLIVGINGGITSQSTLANTPRLSFTVPAWTTDGSAFIDVKGNDANPNSGLYINSWDGRNTYINCHSGNQSVPNNGGRIYMGRTTVESTLDIVTTNSVAFNIDNNGSKFQILSDGKTRIGASRIASGSTHENAMLTVGGEVACKSLYVLKPSTWADYVFEKSYTIQNLTEVEQYIQINKHLPGVPSAEEVKENGYDVNEINKALLEKIENLYLYVIEQQKEIEKLKTKIEE